LVEFWATFFYFVKNPKKLKKIGWILGGIFPLCTVELYFWFLWYKIRRHCCLSHI
jgi:hypothetical protein